MYAYKPSASDLKAESDAEKFTPAAASKIKELRDLQDAVDEKWEVWQNDAKDALLAADETNIAHVMDVQTQKLIQLLSGAISKSNSEEELVSIALGIAAAEANDATTERTVYDKALWKKPLASFEYDFNTPANQPTNSTFRLIYGQSLNKSKSLKITANGAASIYDSQPSSSIPGASRLRDTQFGAEGDYTIPAVGMLNSSLLSMAYYFQDQTSPAILNVTPSSPLSGISFTGLSSSATQVFTQTGHIHLGQVKLTLGNSSSGFSLPISVTASNRTELVVNNKISIRPQIGISYSFDSLLSK